MKVGRDLITSLNDDNERARTCKNRYPRLRDSLLIGHPWNFAIKRVSLAATLVTPEFDYTTEFQLPNDCLRVLNTDLVDLPPSSDIQVTTTFGVELPEFMIEGDKLLADASSVKIRYISAVTDVSKFSEHFANTLELYLAADIAYKFTNSVTLAAELKKAFVEQFSLARSYDAQESGKTGVQTNLWIDARL